MRRDIDLARIEAHVYVDIEAALIERYQEVGALPPGEPKGVFLDAMENAIREMGFKCQKRLRQAREAADVAAAAKETT